jgi:hypothetical protein
LNNTEWLKLYFATTNCKFDLSPRKKKKKFKFPLPPAIYTTKKKDSFKVGIEKESL